MSLSTTHPPPILCLCFNAMCIILQFQSILTLIKDSILRDPQDSWFSGVCVWGNATENSFLHLALEHYVVDGGSWWRYLWKMQSTYQTLHFFPITLTPSRVSYSQSSLPLTVCWLLPSPSHTHVLLSLALRKMFFLFRVFWEGLIDTRKKYSCGS